MRFCACVIVHACLFLCQCQCQCPCHALVYTYKFCFIQSFLCVLSREHTLFLPLPKHTFQYRSQLMAPQHRNESEPSTVPKKDATKDSKTLNSGPSHAPKDAPSLAAQNTSVQVEWLCACVCVCVFGCVRVCVGVSGCTEY